MCLSVFLLSFRTSDVNNLLLSARKVLVQMFVIYVVAWLWLAIRSFTCIKKTRRFRLMLGRVERKLEGYIER